MRSLSVAIDATDLFTVPRELARGVAPWWQWAHFHPWLREMGVAVREGRVARADVMAFWQSLGPRYLNGCLQGRSLLKPRGYSGDFDMMDAIYDNQISAETDLGGWDQLFQSQAAPAAVRNRAEYFAAVAEATQARMGRPLRIASVGCGPARDIGPWLRERACRGTEIRLIDLDAGALARAREVVRGTAAAVVTEHTSLARLRLADQHDVIWAAGLFDYFSDRLFVSSMRKLLPLLPPSGALVIGNFSTSNPTRDYMELCGDWFLHHRTAADLTRLATDALAASPPSRPVRVRVGQEPLGVNLFLELELGA
ncbi:MAG TPA: class I SAM-dependent methyltransferase [Polyangia bacterium]|jgi:SAM-dependent methyltransferase|nr:class I SAM-dependent methyltransferase [Polyangia bacterium]